MLKRLLPIALIAACGGDPDRNQQNPTITPPANGETVRSDKLRNTAPSLPAGDLDDLVTGNRALATDLYQRFRANNDNFFYSPHSISAALAMTYSGAQTQTEQEMAQALHFTLPQNRFHPAFNALDLALTSRGRGAQGADGKPFRLTITNALWGQVGFPFLMDFLDTLALNYDAGLRLVDFVQDTENSRLKINDWVSQQTEGKIPQLLGERTISPMTRLVLTNAVYFNAAWKEQFVPQMTHDQPFTRLDGSTVTVPMMGTQADDVYNYTAASDYEAIELPYDGDEISMVVILPTAGRFNDFENKLDENLLGDILNNLAPSTRSVSLPRWNIRTKYQLEQDLAALGMPSAFSIETADFSGMTGNRDLFIGRVIHEAFVSVDEAGTEAGASTAVVMEFGVPDTVVVDRPFVFLVRDIETNAILFVGRVLDPTA